MHTVGGTARFELELGSWNWRFRKESLFASQM